MLETAPVTAPRIEPPRPRRNGDDGTDPSVGDVVGLVKTYARQQTIGPLKGAGRWLAFGAIGAVLLGLGLVIVLLGLLRLIQTELEDLSDDAWSWIPYLVVLVVCGALIALVISRIKRDELNEGPK